MTIMKNNYNRYMIQMKMMYYNYFDLPNPMLDKTIISNKQFLKDMRSYAFKECKKYSMSRDYLTG